MSRPSNSAPQSPMKMRAGWKLWGKNPTHIPSTITDTIGEIDPSASRPASFRRCAYRKNAPAAIATVPAASPSRPSMKFTALAMPDDPQHGDQRSEVG